ncbi:hypothetical protein A3D78_07175 [Candidatus Gottesmanbacteria bacterium RIFCSPHIGHO2_02_FULL_39_14]|uniref:Glycosyl transferase family 1 n=3 Tax=Candidatus Gottesmaniibacteriota TaxID=1752720 RepID=A0A1F5ZY21_9BACT|nr:MAG: hypothetical protein A2153_00810 [Candidatus Gottesmanbacteria bacterium RBG_16_38_7b]OGG17245.1 MAG: hypothetical protein A3D78_07175 [Candidatus Gottesmanbacteria bacterium RIFCSPHIGHO2_02_FULL_39_14]OGG30910.1 MAG: hypothetical protein A3I51_04890 [Candidatus Gottesmanbacteria bacterium RIFCSPLOWO2_02_FULL_38_8]
MKIAQISYWSCPLMQFGVFTAGGMNVYLYNLANVLAKQNILVDIYTRFHHEQHDEYLKLLPNVNLIHLKSPQDNRLNPQNFASEILKYISLKKINYDLLHAHYYYSGLAGLILKSALKLPLVQTFHTLGEMKKKYVGNVDPRRIAIEKEVIWKADILVASTPIEKRQLKGFYKSDPDKISVINPGVDHKLFFPRDKVQSRTKLKIPPDKKIILFVGRIDPVKGLNILLEAILAIVSKHPEFKNKYQVLLIGGDITNRNFLLNSEVKKILLFLEKNDLSLCTKFLGNKPHHQLPLYYSASDLVVLPSFYESFGLVVLEAMSCRACVLSSKIGGLPFLVHDGVTGSLFKSGDVQNLTEKLTVLLDDDQKRLRLGKMAYQVSLEFSWDKHARSMLSLYQKLV